MLLLILAEVQATTFDATSIMPAVSNLGALGFAVWYAYYATTVAIPKLIEAHRQERTEMMEAHQKERTEMMARFDKTIQDLLTDVRQEREMFMRGLPCPTGARV